MITHNVFCWVLGFFLVLVGIAAIVLWANLGNEKVDHSEKWIQFLTFLILIVVTGIWVSIGIVNGVPN